MPSYEKRPNGSWRVRWSLPRDPLTGKRRAGSQGGFPTRAAAREWHDANVAGRLQVNPATITVRDLAGLWLEHHALRVRPATIFGYRRMLESYALPVLGHVRLRDLEPAHLDAWHAQLAAAGYGPGTIHRAHGVLNQALRYALTRRMLADNPAAVTWPPKPARAKGETWTPDQIARFLAACDDGPYGMLFRTALLTAMRAGELLALRWRNVDLERGVIHVRETETRAADGAWTVGPPKTARSERDLHIPESLKRRLRVYRREMLKQRLALGPAWAGEDERVFTTPRGKRMIRMVVRRQLHRRCDQAGAPRLSMHGLRRAAASWLVALQEHPTLIQERLGHEHIDLTALYAQAGEELDAALAERLDRLLRDG